MKKLFCLAVIAAALFVTSCTKNDESTPQAAAAGWKIGTASFTQVLAMKVPAGVFTQYMAWDKIPTSAESAANSNTNVALNSFGLFFKSAPTAAGKYKIVFKADPTILAANEVLVVTASKAANKSYISTNSTLEADVTVSGGKITCTIPAIKVQEVGTSTVITTDFSGTFVEQ